MSRPITAAVGDHVEPEGVRAGWVLKAQGRSGSSDGGGKTGARAAKGTRRAGVKRWAVMRGGIFAYYSSTKQSKRARRYIRLADLTAAEMCVKQPRPAWPSICRFECSCRQLARSGHLLSSATNLSNDLPPCKIMFPTTSSSPPPTPIPHANDRFDPHDTGVPEQAAAFRLHDGRRDYVFGCASAKEAREWVDAIQRARSGVGDFTRGHTTVGGGARALKGPASNMFRAGYVRIFNATKMAASGWPGAKEAWVGWA